MSTPLFMNPKLLWLHVLICPPVECDILVASCVRFPVNSQSTIQIGGWWREGEIYSDSRHRTKHENRAGFPALGLQAYLDTSMREEQGRHEGGGSLVGRQGGREGGALYKQCHNLLPPLHTQSGTQTPVDTAGQWGYLYLPTAPDTSNTKTLIWICTWFQCSSNVHLPTALDASLNTGSLCRGGREGGWEWWVPAP